MQRDSQGFTGLRIEQPDFVAYASQLEQNKAKEEALKQSSKGSQPTYKEHSPDIDVKWGESQTNLGHTLINSIQEQASKLNRIPEGTFQYVQEKEKLNRMKNEYGLIKDAAGSSYQKNIGSAKTFQENKSLFGDESVYAPVGNNLDPMNWGALSEGVTWSDEEGTFVDADGSSLYENDLFKAYDIFKPEEVESFDPIALLGDMDIAQYSYTKGDKNYIEGGKNIDKGKLKTQIDLLPKVSEKYVSSKNFWIEKKYGTKQESCLSEEELDKAYKDDLFKTVIARGSSTNVNREKGGEYTYNYNTNAKRDNGEVVSLYGMTPVSGIKPIPFVFSDNTDPRKQNNIGINIPNRFNFSFTAGKAEIEVEEDEKPEFVESTKQIEVHRIINRHGDLYAEGRLNKGSDASIYTEVKINEDDISALQEMMTKNGMPTDDIYYTIDYVNNIIKDKPQENSNSEPQEEEDEFSGLNADTYLDNNK